MVVFVIIIIILVIAYFIIMNIVNYSFLKKQFNRCNVIVYGKKGTGKDLLFQAVIKARKKPYYANIDYGYSLEKIVSPIDLELGTNDYKNFIHNKIEFVDKNTKPYENKDFYFSDCGIILPSQYDSSLHKDFKGFPLSYALSRHLWLNNIHCNTQNLNRVWKALREQADFYIRMRGVVKLPFGLLLLQYTCYDRYESANQNLEPLNNRLWNDLSKVERDKYNAMNGLVCNQWIIISKKSIKYDTRAFHNKIFGFHA